MWGGREKGREGKKEGNHTRATSAYVGCEWNRDESKTLNLIGLHKAEERQRQGRKKKIKIKIKIENKGEKCNICVLGTAMSLFPPSPSTPNAAYSSPLRVKLN